MTKITEEFAEQIREAAEEIRKNNFGISSSAERYYVKFPSHPNARCSSNIDEWEYDVTPTIEGDYEVNVVRNKECECGEKLTKEHKENCQVYGMSGMRRSNR